MASKFYLLLFLIFCHGLIPSKAQEREKIWAFGYRAGVDFTSGSPVAVQTAIEGFGEAAASVTDKNGNLLFYTEGSSVWNRNHQLMPNGTNLTPVVSTTSYTPTSSTSQGTLIIPKPGTTDQYYVFSLTSMEQGAQGNAGKMYCSVVDMSLNGGLGDVVTAAKGIHIGSNLSERMTAVVGDRCNVWVLTCGMDARIRAFEVTHAGVDTAAVISPVGIAHEFAGRMSVSPDGKKLAATKCFMTLDGLMGLMLFDFDITTGLASNPVQLLDNYGGYGVCFSPDNSKLYVYGNFSIYQYDLSNPAPAAIRASETKLGDCGATDVKLGPDGKVYFRFASYFGGGSSFGVINNPNLQGVAAGYEPDVFRVLATSNFDLGLPNIVPVFNFDLDTIYSSSVHIVTCFPSGVRLSASDLSGWEYIWNDNTTGGEKTVSGSGSWWVKYFTAPCTYRVDTFNVLLPELAVYPSCRNTATGAARITRASGDTMSYTYVWRDAAGNVVSVSDSLSSVPAGNYTLHIVSGSACNVTVDVTVGSTEYTASFEADSLACVGVPVTFQNTSDSQPGSYYWDFGDGNTSTDAGPEHTFHSPGAYEIMLVKTGDPCADTFYRHIIVDDTVSVFFTVSGDSVCTGDVIRFIPVSDERIASLVWTMDGMMTRPEGAGAFSYVTDRAGDIIVSLTGSFRACPDAGFTDTVHVFPFPVVDLGPDTSICPNAPAIVLMNNHAPAQDGDRFLWNGGETDTWLPVTAPGLYHLTITSAAGCATVDSVIVHRDCYIEIPNVFTPNGDGVNDYFFPRDLLTSRLTGFTMSVYNRWGQKIYETNQTSGRGWDGRFNGELQPEGVYVYVIMAVINGNQTERFQGNVTLLR